MLFWRRRYPLGMGTRTAGRRAPRIGTRSLLVVLALALGVLATAASAAQADTFGKTTEGALSDNVIFPNFKVVHVATLPVNGNVTKLTVAAFPSPGNPTGIEKLKAVIYADSGGSPGALVATGTEVSYSGKTNVAGPFDLPFGSAVSLTAGTYWIGFITGGEGAMGYRFDEVANSRAFNENVFSSGPTNPFGAANKDSEQATIFATYTPTSGGGGGGASGCSNNRIESNFNGTAIPGGDTIWFNSVLKPSGASKGGTIQFRNQKITFSAKGTPFTVSVPDSEIVFSTSASKATTTFSGGKWVTTVPASFSDNVFLSGVAFPVPAGGLPGGINPVTWQGDFTTTGGISLSWQWGAAVYTKFSSEYNELGVKPVHSTSLDAYPSGDQAGTPENFKKFVTGGARGGGGANATGSYSPTGHCKPEPVPGKPHIFVGYADTATNNSGPREHPTPWQGSPGVTFIGCGFGGVDECPTKNGVDQYDAGAIRIDATTESGAVSVTGAKVVIGPCTYEPWPGLSATIKPGETLILTQTGKHQCTTTATAEQTNFDTSESFLKSPQYQEFLRTGQCSKDSFVPVITLIINGQTTTLQDNGLILNTGGLDPDICAGQTEFHEWSQIQ